MTHKTVCPNCGTKIEVSCSKSKRQPISYTLRNVKGGRIEVKEFKPSQNENPKRFKAEYIDDKHNLRLRAEPAIIEFLVKELKTQFHITKEQSDEILNGINSQSSSSAG